MSLLPRPNASLIVDRARDIYPAPLLLWRRHPFAEFAMNVKFVLAGALALGLIGAGAALAPIAIHPAYAACDPGTPIDGTTDQSTRRLMMQQGFTDIKVDQKGCDNVWHVFATKDGKSGRFAVEPGGKVYPESD
jgi:hypothetical protein